MTRARRAPRRRRRAHGARDPRARRADRRRRRACAVDESHVEDAARKRPLVYDKAGDAHYDFISAWIKSTRASDVQASIYYLAVMLEGGEDARFIARRMIVLASEDIGNADPQALLVAVAAAQAVEHVGLPEARLNLAQAAVYLARAPKSNASYRALGAATAAVREHGHLRPPDALRSAAYPGARKLGRGEGYVYPHDDPAGFEVDCLPDELKGTVFYGRRAPARRPRTRRADSDGQALSRRACWRARSRRRRPRAAKSRMIPNTSMRVRGTTSNVSGNRFTCMLARELGLRLRRSASARAPSRRTRPSRPALLETISVCTPSRLRRGHVVARGRP